MKRVSAIWKVIAIVAAVAAVGAAVYLWLRAKKQNCCICGEEDCLCEVECCCDDDCCEDAPIDEPVVE